MLAKLDKDQLAELYNLYHLARTALAAEPQNRQTRYDRKLWAAAEFIKLYPEFSHTQAYLGFEQSETPVDLS